MPRLLRGVHTDGSSFVQRVEVLAMTSELRGEKMNKKILYGLLIGFVLSACASVTETPPTPTLLVPVTPTAASLPTETVSALTPTIIATATGESFTPIPAVTSTSIPNTSIP